MGMHHRANTGVKNTMGVAVMAIVSGVIPEKSVSSLRTGALSFCLCFLSSLASLCVPQTALHSEHD